MSATTINEMLAWLDSLTYDGYNNTPCNDAICTILKEYNKEGVSLITEEEVRLYQLEAIRAFVEQVDIRFRVLGRNVDFSRAMRQELAEMEKEAQ